MVLLCIYPAVFPHQMQKRVLSGVVQCLASGFPPVTEIRAWSSFSVTFTLFCRPF